MLLDKDDDIEKLFLEGYILPYTLENDKLKIRRKICPQLFEVGHNVVNIEKYFYLNLYQIEDLQKNFPEVYFDTTEDIENFANIVTFYPVADCSHLSGDDILGNEYNDPTIGLIYVRVHPGDPMGFFETYSAEELLSTFIEYADFVDPHSRTQEKFGKREIKRLDKLLTDIHQNNEQAACLLDIIESVQIGIFRRSKLIEDTKFYCIENPLITQEFFTQLLHLGFKMRGWSGEGNYPLRSMDTGGTVDYDKLQDEIIAFSQTPTFNILSELPIFLYKAESFEMSIDPKYGYTIKDRINIVLNNSSQNACIRLSSNWFLSTVWYYMNRYFNEEPFPKDNLQSIF